jgi:hypothetical protein
MVLHRVFGQRMDQHGEPIAVQHQIRHDVLELVGLENDQNIGRGGRLPSGVSA